MENTIPLSPEDILLLQPLIDSDFQSKGRNRIPTLEYLYITWRKFVIEIEEKGYGNLSLDDYTNDLCVRDILQRILDACPKHLYDKFSKCIDEWDQRFIQVTKKIEKPLLLSHKGTERGWWWYRIPLYPGERLMEGLRMWKLIE